jgi:hypothetical protein
MPSVPSIDVEAWLERLSQAGPPSADDQSLTWDGRRLNSKEKVLDFLEELELARSEGRELGPA